MEFKIQKYYHGNGKSKQLCIEESRLGKVKYGPQIWYHLNGTKQLEFNCINDLKHGILKNYRSNGTMWFVRQFNSGRINGVDIIFKYEKKLKEYIERTLK